MIQAVLQEIKIREDMLSDREAKLQEARENNDNVLRAINKVGSEHEDERHRLKVGYQGHEGGLLGLLGLLLNRY